MIENWAKPYQDRPDRPKHEISMNQNDPNTEKPQMYTFSQMIQPKPNQIRLIVTTTHYPTQINET